MSVAATHQTEHRHFHAFTFGVFGDLTAADVVTPLRGEMERLGVMRFRGEELCRRTVYEKLRRAVTFTLSVAGVATRFCGDCERLALRRFVGVAYKRIK